MPGSAGRAAVAEAGANHEPNVRARALNSKALELIKQNAYDRAVSVLEFAVEADRLDGDFEQGGKRLWRR